MAGSFAFDAHKLRASLVRVNNKNWSCADRAGFCPGGRAGGEGGHIASPSSSNWPGIGKLFPYNAAMPTLYSITPKLLIAAYADERALPRFYVKTQDGGA